MTEPLTPLGWGLYSWRGGGIGGAVESVVPILTTAQLQTELDRLRFERPQYVELVKPGMAALCLGIAPAVASVEWREGADLRLVVRALAPSEEGEVAEVEFDAPGGGVEYEREYLLPYSHALRVILDCVERGSFPDWAAQERQRVGSLDVERKARPSG